ncbi:MAG: methyltransferase type 12 [Candidatus Gottesmanbacteria bacterium GW2011_GWA2_43_14]|uniref:Methyltransferase type 12 n=1 Tax=Candidatus Gottesmanbacteria bacterium GW2011_GWA2_43_14 TaxID=1618443 RepID=A0A0G1DIW1_9BACT|nr:MAG: methyltransferase type 12 [Candidatus Gottesmanbacteria bacterium GW2011_GWA2_43_14]
MNKRLSQKEKYKKKAYKYDTTVSLGPWTSTDLIENPIHLTFVLARYKFVARHFSGKKSVLEIGCGDAFGTPIVAQFVRELTAIDIDSSIIISNKNRLSTIKNIKFQEMDIRKAVPAGKYDGIFALDVIEHIESEYNDLFFRQILKCIKEKGILILGTPNQTAERYASKRSREYHVNLQSYESLKTMMNKYFRQVFMFTMNDEVVQTGYGPMGHYLFSIGVS